MRKRLVAPISKDAPAADPGWLELDRVAVVEVTSEEKEYGSSLRRSQAKRRAGGPPILVLKPSG